MSSRETRCSVPLYEELWTNKFFIYICVINIYVYIYDTCISIYVHMCVHIHLVVRISFHFTYFIVYEYSPYYIFYKLSMVSSLSVFLQSVLFTYPM